MALIQYHFIFHNGERKLLVEKDIKHPKDFNEAIDEIKKQFPHLENGVDGWITLINRESKYFLLRKPSGELKLQGTFSCIKCGNCCRVGGPCDVYAWRSIKASQAHLSNFEGVCPALNEDGTCSIILKARSGEISSLHESCLPFLDKFLKGVCTKPQLRKEKMKFDSKIIANLRTECITAGIVKPDKTNIGKLLEHIHEQQTKYEQMAQFINRTLSEDWHITDSAFISSFLEYVAEKMKKDLLKEEK